MWAKRNRALLWALAIAVVVILCWALFGSTWLGESRPRPFARGVGVATSGQLPAQIEAGVIQCFWRVG
jgi:hypothetical protein